MEAAGSTAAAFEVLFDMLPTCAVVLAPVYEAAPTLVDFTFYLVNPAAQHLLGLPARPTATLLQHGPAGLLEPCRLAFASGERTQFMLPYQGKGSDSHYQLVAQRTGERLVVHFADSMTPSTEATQQEPRANQPHEQVARTERAQQQLIETVFEQAPAGVWVVQGTDYVFELFNPQMGEVLGPTPEQALGRPYFEVMPELVSQGIPELLRQVWETGEAVLVEEFAAHLLRHAPGQMGYFTFVFQPLRDAQGQVTHISCVALDVTSQVVARQRVEQVNQQLDALVRARTQELATAQAETERERTLLQAMFAQAPVAIGLFQGEELRVAATNPLMAALWGHTPEQVLGRPLLEGVPELRGQGFDNQLRQVLRTQVPITGTEVPATMWRNGQLTTTYYNFVYQPLYNADGEVLGVIDVAVEVTEQVQARQQIEQFNQELEGRVRERTEHIQLLNEEMREHNNRLTRTNADLDTFIYTASHDLKAPIANIEGLANALLRELPPDVAQGKTIAHLLHLMRDSVARFQRTLSHLTDLTQLQQVGAAQREEIDLPALVESVRLDLAPLLETTHGQLQTDLDGCLRLWASPRTLRSIVFNLVSNALKYHHPERPPLVQLSAHCTPQQMVLQVQDNGLGLSPEQQSALFWLFRRLHTHTEGSGVGLYAMKKLIDNAGGTVAVASTLGMGSTFTVTLPLAY